MLSVSIPDEACKPGLMPGETLMCAPSFGRAVLADDATRDGIIIASFRDLGLFLSLRCSAWMPKLVTGINVELTGDLLSCL